jgi:hypothetical protein
VGVDANDLALRKRRLSPKLLAVPGISGVGLRNGGVVVYLDEDADEVRETARSLVEADEPGTPLSFDVTGRFQKR